MRNPFKIGMMAIAEPRNKQIKLLTPGRVYPVLDVSGGNLICVRNDKGEARWYKHTNFAETSEPKGVLADMLDQLPIGDSGKLPAGGPERQPSDTQPSRNATGLPILESKVEMGLEERQIPIGSPIPRTKQKKPRRMKIWERIKYMLGLGWI